MLASCHHLLNCRTNLSKMDSNIFDSESHHCLTFSNFVLSWVFLFVIPSQFGTFFEFFFILSIHSGFRLCSFLLHVLIQNCFVSLVFSWWFVFVHLWLNLIVILVCPVYLNLYQYFSSFPFFANIFRFLSFCCLVSLVSVCLLESFCFCLVPIHYTLLRSFAYCRSFFICLSSLTSIQILYFFSDSFGV